jgi:cell wall-associated NlpC family hydrolase
MAGLAVPARLVGIPFVTGGRGLGGCDCWGLLRLAYAELLGIELPRLDLDPPPAVEEQVQEQGWIKVSLYAERPGDVLAIRVDGWPVHVAMVAAPALMLHTTEGACSRLERYRTPLWRHRIQGVYRHPAVVLPRETAA